jgi:Tfp pilus assembly protein FimT
VSARRTRQPRSRRDGLARERAHHLRSAEAALQELPRLGRGEALRRSGIPGPAVRAKLSTGDQVCLEGGFGDTPSAACAARAAVVDSSKDLVLLEVREAKPDSRWFNKEQNQFWFEEGALVDLYLADHGY